MGVPETASLCQPERNIYRDLYCLPSKKDVFADDMGVWKHTGPPS